MNRPSFNDKDMEDKMKYYRIIFFVWLSVLSCTAGAAKKGLTVVPAIDLGFKNNSYTVPAVDVDLKFKSSFNTLVPSLTLAYGPMYASMNYDFTVTDSEKYITGTAANSGFSSIGYSRKDASLTLGYRPHPAVNIFGGYTQGKGTMLYTGFDNTGTPSAATRIFNEDGFYVGAGFSHAFSDKGVLSLSAAYGSLNGLLAAATETDSSEIDSKAPGYSLNLGWVQATTSSLSYRVGVKYTTYEFEGRELRNNGVVTPMPRPFDYYEKIMTYYIGVVDYF
jgi:hypothetical protein